MKSLSNAFVLLVMVGIYSCTKSPEEKLIKEAEKYFESEVLPKFNDPKSYEKVSTEILDTIYLAESLKEQIEITYSALEVYEESYKKNQEYYSNWGSKIWKDMMVEDENKIALGKIELDSLNRIYEKADKKKIYQIELVHTFRANIPLGGLMLGKYGITYYPNETEGNKFVWFKIKNIQAF